MREEIHPSARTWKIHDPPAGGVSLRALAARPERFEHHLMVVARIGEVQLELATASEPLYFAHANVSDEYALPLPTGDPELDAMPFRVFLSDPDDAEDVARIVHRAGDLVLHPHGYLHWPGRLRPPFEPPRFLPGARRAVLSLVMCACRPTPPVDRPLFTTRDDAKISRGAPPILLAELARTPPGVIARIAHATLSLVDRAVVPRGGYAVLWESGDLVYLPPGARFDARCLLFASDTHTADSPPPSWERAPDPPFDPLPHTSLPWSRDGIDVRAIDDRACAITIGTTATVPRYWLARMLFRVALHGFSLGYVETYGGFFYDDRDGLSFGVRGGSRAPIERDDVESLYRAVAPPGYEERI